MFRSKNSPVSIDKTDDPGKILSPTRPVEKDRVGHDLPEDFWQIDGAEIFQPCSGAGYEIALDIFFNARHHVTMEGHRGPEHAHSYRLQVRCRSQSLAQDDHVVIGYHTLREHIQLVAHAYNGQSLNDLPPFQQIQPTTENLTAVIYQQLVRTLRNLPIKLVGVTIWDSPTEAITYVAAGWEVE
jgi:6-pyruvoyltetrahydropterin/6-carboxytetrahydropterin synthase